MCGFILEYSPSQLLPEVSFREILRHSVRRGPDDTRYLNISNTVQFGFNRLAILDLSSNGAQPMSSHSKRYSMVYNGEIYNHLQLRRELKHYPFKGHSDSETILACFETYGIAASIAQFDGMFAIGVYDHQMEETHLIRDFAGIKPLFYGFREGTLFAASQYDQIRLHPKWKYSEINQEVLKLFLEQHFIPAPYGMHQFTGQVAPGEWVSFGKNGLIGKQTYYAINSNPTIQCTDKNDALELVWTTLQQSVESQLLSDVPIGTFLSGGTDSPLITAASHAVNPAMTAFTIGSDSVIHDESERATRFAEALHLKHEIWHLNAREVLNYWDSIMHCIHEPFADLSIIPTFLLSKLASSKVKVALSGDGGDELFFGYNRFSSMKQNIRFQSYPSLIRKGSYYVSKTILGNKGLNSAVIYPTQGEAHRAMHSRLHRQQIHSLIPHLSEVQTPQEWNVYQYPNASKERDLMNHMRVAEYYGMLQKTLRKTDLASMENSLEVRVPFLSKQMINASLQIDPLLNINRQRKKIVLHGLIQRKYPGVASDEVKKGFSVPFGKWIKSDLKQAMYDTLTSQKALGLGFAPEAVNRMLQEHITGTHDHKWALFTLYVLAR